jgi:hypothetical protein
MQKYDDYLKKIKVFYIQSTYVCSLDITIGIIGVIRYNNKAQRLWKGVLITNN